MPVAEVESELLAGVGFWVVLMTMKATTMTMTPRMLPPVHSIRLRTSRLSLRRTLRRYSLAGVLPLDSGRLAHYPSYEWCQWSPGQGPS